MSPPRVSETAYLRLPVVDEPAPAKPRSVKELYLDACASTGARRNSSDPESRGARVMRATRTAQHASLTKRATGLALDRSRPPARAHRDVLRRRRSRRYPVLDGVPIPQPGRVLRVADAMVWQAVSAPKDRAVGVTRPFQVRERRRRNRASSLSQSRAYAARLKTMSWDGGAYERAEQNLYGARLPAVRGAGRRSRVHGRLRASTATSSCGVPAGLG